MDQQKIQALIRAYRKDILKISLKSSGLCLLSFFPIAALTLAANLQNTDFPTMTTLMTAVIVYTGYSIPQIRLSTQALHRAIQELREHD